MTLRLRRSELDTGFESKDDAKAMSDPPPISSFLNLEDAVAPAQEAARKNAVDALRNLDWGTKIRACVCNGADPIGQARDNIAIDVVEGASDKLDVIIVPKPKARRVLFDTLC